MVTWNMTQNNSCDSNFNHESHIVTNCLSQNGGHYFNL
jgi:hypothetical protein